MTLLPSKLMHDTYQHENIQVFLCKKRRPPGVKGGASAAQRDDTFCPESSARQDEGVQRGTAPLQQCELQGTVEPDSVQHQHQHQQEENQALGHGPGSSLHPGGGYYSRDPREDRGGDDSEPAEAADHGLHSAGGGAPSAAGAAAEQWAARRTGAAIAQMLGGVTLPSAASASAQL